MTAQTGIVDRMTRRKVDALSICASNPAALTDASLVAMGTVTIRNALAGLDGRLDPDLVVDRSMLRGPGAPS